MNLKQKWWVAALPRLSVVAAILLTSCSLQPAQEPTPTLIVLPTLPPAPTAPGVAQLPSLTPQGTGIGPTAQPGTPLLPPQTPGTVTHTVLPGESLESIAAQYGVTIQAIQAANGITNPNLIFVGQHLIIPLPAGTIKPPTPNVGPIPATSVATGAACSRDATFVSDVTIPDSTPMKPGQVFTKTWRVKNSGTCAWDNSYTMIFVSGNPMGAPSFVPLPLTAAGAIADISVAMTAPTTPGRFTGSWQIRGPDGIKFGTEPYLIITVVPPSGVIPPTSIPATPTRAISPTQPPPPPSSGYPAVSGVTAYARQIYLNGKRLGNRRDIFSKVGDSITDEPWFLHQIGDGQAAWNKVASLSPVADFFRADTAHYANSFSNTSVATHGGWDSFSALDPANSTAFDYCGSDSPLVCELRVTKPSVALIMFGTNDAQDHLSGGSYEQNLRKMVQICIDRGVIPVLYTIPWNKFRDPQPFNTVITRVARTYGIPLVDYWSLVDPLPNHGISDDGVHPSVPPDQNTANFSSDNLQYGYTVRNLVTLEALDVIWRQALYP